MNKIGRREFSRRGVLSSLALVLSPLNLTPQIASANAFSYQCRKWVAEYDALGWHRTGSSVDDLTTEWLLAGLEKFGVSPKVHAYTLPFLSSFNSTITLDNQQIDAMPLYDSGREVEIAGSIGFVGDDAEIAVVFAPPHYSFPGSEDLINARNSGRYKAVIAISSGVDLGLKAGLNPLNADSYLSPFGPPVIQVGSEHTAFFQSMVRESRVARIQQSLIFKESVSKNVSVFVEGASTHLNPIVVLTPMTGWWHCASERGSGISVWLQLLQDVMRAPMKHPVIFLATTGHELDECGLKNWLASVENNTFHSCLHLGACFGGAGAFRQVQGSSAALAQEAATLMIENHIEPDRVVFERNKVVGEVGVMSDYATRYLSISGVNPWFHSVRDRDPASMDYEALASMYNALSSWLKLLDNEALSL